MGLEDLRKNLAVKKASSQTSRDAWHDGMVVDPLFASAALYAVKNGSIGLADLSANFHIDPVRSNKILGQLVEYHVIFSSGKKWLVCMPKDMLEKYLVRYVRKYQDIPQEKQSSSLQKYDTFRVSSESYLAEEPVYLRNIENKFFKQRIVDVLRNVPWVMESWNLVKAIHWLCTLKSVDENVVIGYHGDFYLDGTLMRQLEVMGAFDSWNRVKPDWQMYAPLIADAIEYELTSRRIQKPSVSYRSGKSVSKLTSVVPYSNVRSSISVNASVKSTKTLVGASYKSLPEHLREEYFDPAAADYPSLIPVNQDNLNGLPAWSDVQNMTGVQFENYCMEVLRLNGFTDVHGTVTSGDGGVDILARKSGESYAIQCKRWKGSVGYKAVQEIFAGKSLEGADKAVVMTNSHFSQPAHDNAKKLGVILWDGKYVQSMANVVPTQKSVTQQQPQPKKQSVFGQVVSAFKDITRSPAVLVDYGSIVTVRMGNEVQAFTIVSSSEADIHKSRISDTSPIGAALMGHQKGDVVIAHTPDGDVRIDIAAVDNRNVIVR